MSEQQFEVFQECEYLEEWSSCPYCIKYNGETVFETLPLGIAKEVCKKLNEQQATIQRLQFDLKECRARKEIMGEKLKKYQDIAKEYDCVSSVKLAEKIDEQQATIQLLKDFIKKEFPKSYKHILEGLDE